MCAYLVICFSIKWSLLALLSWNNWQIVCYLHMYVRVFVQSDIWVCLVFISAVCIKERNTVCRWISYWRHCCDFIYVCVYMYEWVSVHMCECGGQATLGVVLQELSTLLLRQGDSVALGLLSMVGRQVRQPQHPPVSLFPSLRLQACVTRTSLLFLSFFHSFVLPFFFPFLFEFCGSNSKFSCL